MVKSLFARFSARALAYGAVLLVSTHCRCRYEVVLFEDGGADASTDASAQMDASTDADTSDAATAVVFALTDETHTLERGEFMGTGFDDDCLSDQVLVGFSGTTQGDGLDLVTGFSGRCASLSLDVDGTTLLTTQTEWLPFRGSVSDAVFELSCAPNQVIVGFAGRAGTSLDQLTFECAPLTLVANFVAIGTRTTLPPYGGNGGTPYTQPCPDGKVARGVFGSAQSFTHSIGLACVTPVPAP